VGIEPTTRRLRGSQESTPIAADSEKSEQIGAGCSYARLFRVDSGCVVRNPLHNVARAVDQGKADSCEAAGFAERFTNVIATAPLVLASMHREHDDFAVQHAEVNRVRKAPEYRPSRLSASPATTCLKSESIDVLNVRASEALSHNRQAARLDDKSRTLQTRIQQGPSGPPAVECPSRFDIMGIVTPKNRCCAAGRCPSVPGLSNLVTDLTPNWREPSESCTYVASSGPLN
jgi:hypothetical protein